MTVAACDRFMSTENSTGPVFTKLLRIRIKIKLKLLWTFF